MKDGNGHEYRFRGLPIYGSHTGAQYQLIQYTDGQFSFGYWYYDEFYIFPYDGAKRDMLKTINNRELLLSGDDALTY